MPVGFMLAALFFSAMFGRACANSDAPALEPAAEATDKADRDTDDKDDPSGDGDRSDVTRPKKVSADERADALRRARIWRAPATPIGQASFAGDPKSPREISCRFQPGDLGGTTPKFDCVAEDGKEVRVKYGKGPEIPAELATTRLLRALGFGADDVQSVEKLRCYGCPIEPFSTMKAVEVTRSGRLYEKTIDYSKFREFEWVAIERKFPARPIETETVEGWSMFELDTIDPSKGGAPRAHVDALRLLSVFLAHWDNKSENQRLVCLSQTDWKEGHQCREPFLLLQDVGATWGPRKVDLDEWRRAPIWEDRATCVVSMKTMPYDGATFTQSRISEQGRTFLSGLLAQLTDAQLTELFSAARFDKRQGLLTDARPVAAWVAAFKDRLRQIGDGAPCPTT